MRAIRALIFCTGLGLLAGACSQGAKPDPQRAAARPQAVKIRVVGVDRVSLQRRVDLVGTLLSPDQAKVSSEVAGVVRQVLVELGQEVKPNQILVRLEPRELALASERAESALRQTEAQLGITRPGGEPPPDSEIASVRTATATRDDVRSQLARASDLVEKGLLPHVELENSQTRMKVAEAAYQAALDNVHSLKASLQDRRASYDLAQKKLNDAVIRTPVAGSIAERFVQPGEFIRENTQVVTVVQMNPLKLKTAVQERYANLIRPGLAVQFRVESFPGVDFAGKVAYVSPSVDQGTRTFPVEVLVDNADRRLKPGFFAKGTISTHQDDNVLAIPDEAVSTLAGASTVYIIDQGKVRRQSVSLGVHLDKSVEIVEGLKGDEILAASNLGQLSNGVPVEAEGKTREKSGADPGTEIKQPQDTKAPGAGKAKRRSENDSPEKGERP